jgi:hypothetical protein
MKKGAMAQLVIGAFLFVPCTASIAQLYDTPESRKQKAEAAKRAQQDEVRAKDPAKRTLAPKEAEATGYVGKTFWYLPNPSANNRLRFYEKIPSSSHSQDPNVIFTPLTITSFVVTRIVMPPPVFFAPGEDEYLLEVKFLDGKIGYVNVVGCCGIKENLYSGERIKHNEYVFSRPVEEVLTQEREVLTQQRALAEAKAQEERAAREEAELRQRLADEAAERERVAKETELQEKQKRDEARRRAQLRQQADIKKAEAVKEPTPAEKAKMTSRANGMKFWQLCTELGRVLRSPNTTPKGQYWESAVIAASGIPAADQGYVRARRLRIGMDECSVAAILGKPDDMNRTNHAGGRSDQLVYRSKGMYVYTENGIVRSWQE